MAEIGWQVSARYMVNLDGNTAFSRTPTLLFAESGWD